jgi:hypothetical protein
MLDVAQPRAPCTTSAAFTYQLRRRVRKQTSLLKRVSNEGRLRHWRARDVRAQRSMLCSRQPKRYVRGWPIRPRRAADSVFMCHEGLFVRRLSLLRLSSAFRLKAAPTTATRFLQHGFRPAVAP